MNVLINTQSFCARNAFINALLPSGITLYYTENSANVIGKIQAHQPEIVVLDVIEEGFKHVNELVSKIKHHSAEEVKKAAIILLIGNIDREEITAAMKLGVTGFIKSNAEVEVIYKYIMDTYQKVKGKPAVRKYVRVNIDPHDKISVKFRSADSQFILGQIKCISLGGIAIELVGNTSNQAIAVGSLISNIQFILDGKDILLDGIVVANLRNNCVLRFNNMPPEIVAIISQFIFKMLFIAEDGRIESRRKTCADGTSGNLYDF